MNTVKTNIIQFWLCFSLKIVIKDRYNIMIKNVYVWLPIFFYY